MRKYLLFLILIVSALGAKAQSKYLDLGINFRTDYYAAFSNMEPNQSRINLNTLKLMFSGQVYPGITYLIQQRLNNAVLLESDKYTSDTEYAYFNFALNNRKWDFTVGKQDILFGTFESNYDPSDMYLISMVFDNFNRSQVGIAARYRWPLGNTVSVQVSNVTGNQLSVNSNNSFAYTLNTTQNFFSNMLNTSLGYSLIYSGDSHYYNWLTFGSQLQVRQLFVELDAYAGRYRQNMTFDANQDNFREADNFSVSVNSRYRINDFVPFAKVVYDYQLDVDSDDMSKRSIGAGVGLEYYPVKGQDLRLHGVYLFRYNRFGDPWLDRQGNESNHRLSIGVKWNVSLGEFLASLRK